MIITEVAPLDKKRRKVYIDGEYTFPLYLSEIRKYHIEADYELSDEEYEVIKAFIVKRIIERIMYLLGDTDRTERDIIRKMVMAGYGEEYVTIAVNRLKEYGYIDDYRFAASYAESLRDNRGKSRRIIEGKLYEKGVPKDIITEVMDALPMNEEDQLLRALAKKRISPEDLNGLDMKERNRIYAYLARQGFSSSLISHYFGH